MKNKEVFTGLKGKGLSKALRGMQYWIAAVSYLIIFSLSIVCLASYLPNLSGAEVLDTGTLNILRAMLIIMLVFSTAAFGWEMLQWRKNRVKKEQPSLEDIIKDVNKDTSNSD
jgi:hypothetical protein